MLSVILLDPNYFLAQSGHGRNTAGRPADHSVSTVILPLSATVISLHTMLHNTQN